MEIVIKIPEDVYTRLFDKGIQDNEIAVDDICEMARAIRLGTPLEAQPSEDTEVIKVSKGVVKARQGRFVIYDVDWLKKNFYSTEEKIYGQPKHPCEDCISRELAIEHIKGCCEDDGLYCVDDGEIIINIIKALPSVIPQRKVGKWIEVGSEDNPAEHHFECSECGNTLNWLDEYDHYCRNCGSKNWEG